MSVYRVSTANTYDRALFNIQQRQTQLGVSQDQLSSGKRVLRASDDAVAATLSERAQNRLSRTEADLRGLEASRRSIAQAESTLGDVSDLYGRIKELVVQAGDGVLKENDKKSIALELSGIREQLIGLANQKDTAGSPLFAGLGSTSATGDAFVESVFPAPLPTPIYGPDGRAVTWEGMDGQYAATNTTLPATLDGSLIFGKDGVNVWETLDRAIFSLGGGSTGVALNGADLTAELATIHGEMDQHQDNLLAARGKLGDWLNRADTMENVFSDRAVAYEKENSELVDLDMVAGISNFQKNQTAYQAALQSYSQVQKMSMFDYMR
jgi:flagellar hook-associated protein 3 FlgL